MCHQTHGHWHAQALERIAGLLEAENGSITLAERGDVSVLGRHPNFRLLAAMNPATDAGKRDLPAAVRNRFTGAPPNSPFARASLSLSPSLWLRCAPWCGSRLSVLLAQSCTHPNQLVRTISA